MTKGKCDQYDLILGRNFGQTLGNKIINKSLIFKWDNVEVPIVPIGHWSNTKNDIFRNSAKKD